MTASEPTSTPEPPSLDAPGITTYMVQSTDVLQEMRINVNDENSDKIIWYKERFLTEHEIIDHLVHNPTNTIVWTIHRPAKRGWYIRLRSPTFAPGLFIPLIPVSTKSPYYSEGALSFHCRTDYSTVPERLSLSSTHSYPPTPPPRAVVRPPSPRSIRAKLDAIPQEREDRQHEGENMMQVSQFILSPHSTQVTHPASNSLLARALSALRNSQPSRSNSFTLSRIPSVSSSAPPPYLNTARSAASPHHTLSMTLTPPPLVLTFHDRTPVLTVHSFTGRLEIENAEERLLGVDRSFWIAITLTFLEFLEERESYLAALGD